MSQESSLSVQNTAEQASEARLIASGRTAASQGRGPAASGGPLGAPGSGRQGHRVRTFTLPTEVKARIDQSTAAAGITERRLFRPLTKAGLMKGTEILGRKVASRLVVRYAREPELGKLVSHDLRRTCAKLCRKDGWDLDRSRRRWARLPPDDGRYLGTEQNLASAVNIPCRCCSSVRMWLLRLEEEAEIV